MASVSFPPNLLTEGLRFGNREIQSLLNANDILCGLEFEFHTNGSGVDWDYFLDEYKERIYYNFYEDFIYPRFEDITPEDDIYFFAYFKSNAHDLATQAFIRDTDEVSRTVERLKRLQPNDPEFITLGYRLIDKLQHITFDSDTFSEEVSDINGDDLANFVVFTSPTSMNKSQAKAFVDYMKAASNLYLDVNDLMNDIDLLDLEIKISSTDERQMTIPFEELQEDMDAVSSIIEAIDESVQGLVRAAAKERNPLNVISTLAEMEDNDEDVIRALVETSPEMYQKFEVWWDREKENMLSQVDSFESSNDHGRVDYIEGLLHDEGLWNKCHIREVTLDGSVSQGVEVITKPFPIRDAEQVLKDMFNFISDHGYTSSQTGLHVNLSIRGKDMRKVFSDQGTALKLWALIDERFIRRGGAERRLRDHKGRRLKSDIGDTYWAPREYVRDVLSPGAMNGLMLRLHHEKANKFDDIVKIMSGYIRTDNKYQGINYGNLNVYNEKHRRIEFRYMGDDGYEDMLKEVYIHVMRYAYILRVAANPIFGRREFIQKIMNILNEAARELFDARDYQSFLRLSAKDVGNA